LPVKRRAASAASIGRPSALTMRASTALASRSESTITPSKSKITMRR